MTKADLLNRLKAIYDECSEVKAKDNILSLIIDIGSDDNFNKYNPTIANLPYYSYKSERNNTGTSVTDGVYSTSSTLTTKKAIEMAKERKDPSYDELLSLSHEHNIKRKENIRRAKLTLKDKL